MRSPAADARRVRPVGQDGIRRNIVYESQQGESLIVITVVFIVAQFIMMIDSRYFDIQNPLGLPIGLSQGVFYIFGLTFAVVLARDTHLVFPWRPAVGLLWVLGLTLGSVVSKLPGEAFPQAVSYAIYFASGYGIYKACLNDRILKVALLVMAVVGLGWAIFIVMVFISNGGHLPHRYTAYLGYKGSFNHHAYGLLIINGGVAALALISKSKKPVATALMTFIVFATFSAVIVSQSRACFVAFAATAGYVVLKSDNVRGRGRVLIKWLWVLATIVAIFWGMREGSLFSEDVVKRFDFQDQEYQLQKSEGRLQMIRKGLILIARNPLGVGGYNARSSGVSIDELNPIEGYMLHNQYITAVAEGGWVVLIPLVVLVNSTLVRPFRNRWSSPVRLGIYCCWLNISVLLLFAEMMGNLWFLLLFMCSAAIALEKRDIKNRAGGGAPLGPPRGRIGLAK